MLLKSQCFNQVRSPGGQLKIEIVNEGKTSNVKKKNLLSCHQWLFWKRKLLVHFSSHLSYLFANFTLLPTSYILQLATSQATQNINKLIISRFNCPCIIFQLTGTGGDVLHESKCVVLNLFHTKLNKSTWYDGTLNSQM